MSQIVQFITIIHLRLRYFNTEDLFSDQHLIQMTSSSRYRKKWVGDDQFRSALYELPKKLTNRNFPTKIVDCSVI